MKAEEFISFAGRVVGYGQAGARSAVSRAYYGVFHVAVALLDELGCAPTRNSNAHKLVPEFLKCSAHLAARSASTLLSDLHVRRMRSDYRLADSGAESLAFAKLSVENADEAISLLMAFRTACEDEQVLQQLKRGIEQLKAVRQI